MMIITYTSASQDLPGGYDPKDDYGDRYKSKTTVEPYFFFDLKFSTMMDDYGTELGAGLGASINREFFLTVEYYNLISNNARVVINDSISNALSNGYGGLAFAYSYFPLEIVMLSVGTFAGVGRISNTSGNIYGLTDFTNDDLYFVFEPRVKTGFRVYKGIWIGFTAAYKFPLGVNYYNYGNDELTGPAFSIGIFTL